MSQTKTEILLSNIPHLQNKIRRDPVSYQNEFRLQYNHFLAELEILKLNPSLKSDSLETLILFIAHITSCYRSETGEFPKLLISLLEKDAATLDPTLRKTMVQALILMKNKNELTSDTLLPLFFNLFKCRDKQLREMLKSFIVNDVKRQNLKGKDNKLNKKLQNFMYKVWEDGNEIAAQKSLEVMIELYHKNIWNDAKTVNVIAEACFSQNPKVIATALNFFLGTDKPEEEDEDDEDIDIQSLQHSMSVNKRKKSKKAAYQKALATVKKVRNNFVLLDYTSLIHLIRQKAKKSLKAESTNFSAHHLLNDPQGFSERLFSRLRASSSSSTIRFPLRLSMMNFISRLISIHKLILIQFYEFLVPYLQPHQRDVIQILAFAAQATHELTPPDEISKIVECIADRFIWSNCATEVVVAGLNGIREICIRSPLAMSETLLQSLIDDYKNHKQKGAMNAARALLGVYREINPEMLKKKDRESLKFSGKNASINMKTFVAPKYAQFNVVSGVEGAEFLSTNEKSDNSNENNAEESGNEGEGPGDGWEGWEVDSDGEKSNGEQDDETEEWEDADSDAEGEEETDVESDDNDDEEEDDSEEPIAEKPATEESVKRVPEKRIELERILTDEDFKKIRSIKMKQEVEKLSGMKGKELTMTYDSSSNEEEEEQEDSEFITPTSLLQGVKRKRTDELSSKSDEPKQKYGSKKGKFERSSLTNKIKSKKSKAVMMMVHKREVKGKAKRSLKDKSVSEATRILFE
ncbi:Protein SDA1 [Nowakowskiella sp. JEL0407]|nr:Protein SDA1 [Nowakowskiella sp. JEL0407]